MSNEGQKGSQRSCAPKKWFFLYRGTWGKRSPLDITKADKESNHDNDNDNDGEYYDYDYDEADNDTSDSPHNLDDDDLEAKDETQGK